MKSVSAVGAVALLVLSTMGCGPDSESETETETSQVPDPNCDELLTPADFLATCGTELVLNPTAFEGIALNPCNRATADDDVLLVVSRHSSASVAQSGADVAGGRGPSAQSADLQASAGAASIFVVEVKAREGGAAICSPDTLPVLLDIALSRIAP